MNGEIPSVPITTLAGIASLTDLLPELPLPGPGPGAEELHSPGSNLLFHPTLAEEATRQLHSVPSEDVLERLSRALSNTRVDYIELKDSADCHSYPMNNLFNALCQRNPALFDTAGGANHQKHQVNQQHGLQQQWSNSSDHNHAQYNNVGHAASATSVYNNHNNSHTTGYTHQPHMNSQYEPISETQVMNSTHGEQRTTRSKRNGDVIPDEAPKVKAEDKKNLQAKLPMIKLNKLSKEAEEMLAKGSMGNFADKEKAEEMGIYNNFTPRTMRSQKSSTKAAYDDGEESSGSDSDYAEESNKKGKNKFFRATEKEHEEERRRRKEERRKRREAEDAGGDDEFSRSSHGGKRRKTDFAQPPSPAPFVPKKVTRKIERNLIPMIPKINPDELLEESNTFQRFNKLVELIFDNLEEINLQELNDGLAAATASDGDVEIPPEILIPKYQLADLAVETAKLRSLGVMESISSERLVKLLNLLELNIRDGSKVVPLPSGRGGNSDDENSDEEPDDHLWLELAVERVSRATDASLAALHILTSRNMPKCVYIDDVIDRVALFLRFQLSNTIYPSYDPVYKEITKSKTGYVGSMKKKRAHATGSRDKNVLALYNKATELVAMLGDLVRMQLLTDTTILHISTLGVAPFFVEAIPELQLAALKLVTNLFSKYDNHRKLLLDDILASIARLPSSKRSLRTYRLGTDNQYIQMMTALVLQLIQCVVILPRRIGVKDKNQQQPNAQGSAQNNEAEASKEMDRDVLISSKYEMAMATAYEFLTVFLKKCGSKNEDIDYRPLFENFVQDLLTTVNTPEWPAAELLLSMLGRVLRDKFMDRGTELSLRISSLEYLGVVAARLRKDAVQSKTKVDYIDSIIKIIKEEEKENGADGGDDGGLDEEDDLASRIGAKKSAKKKKKAPVILTDDPEEERIIFLQRVLLDFLAITGGADDQCVMNARHFYICQWYRDLNALLTGRSPKKQPPLHQKQRQNSKKSKSKSRRGGRGRRGSVSTDEEEEDDFEDEEAQADLERLKEGEPISDVRKAELYRQCEARKDFLLGKILPFGVNYGHQAQTLTTHIDADSAHLIVKYLSSKRPFFNSFKEYLHDIISVVNEQSTQIRTKALKCMSMIVAEDPDVLLRKDMQSTVKFSFTDPSTLVREAAVNLIGKFILHKPELVTQYYDMITARILDTGVSVRKRVILILKEVCLEFPNYERIPEICVKIIRRINDEEGIRKLVMDVFQNMWFVPLKEKNRNHEDEQLLITRARNITDVVVECRETGLEWFEQLLETLFRPREDKEDSTKKNTEASPTLVLACQQIVDCLVESVLREEEKSAVDAASCRDPEQRQQQQQRSSRRVVACLTTLYLFARIRPQLLVEHAQTLQPYLQVQCKTQADYAIISAVALTLELSVPLIKHPSEIFLSQLEEDAVKLILQHDKKVVAACLSLLGSVVNNVTKNFGLVRDCFVRYYGQMSRYREVHEEYANDPRLIKPATLTAFRRAMFTVSLLLRHFDFSKEDLYLGLQGGPDTVEEVFETIFYFMRHDSREIQSDALHALGSVCIRHYNLMLESKLKHLYIDILTEDFYSVQHKIKVLNNLENFLSEEEIRMRKLDEHWKDYKDKENLKEMGDVSSGMASTVIQVYLKSVLDSFIHPSVMARHAALKVITLILAQGLVHPVQIVPYLICMSTDAEPKVSHTADRELQEIEKKYPGFIHMKLLQGIKLSHRLQEIEQQQLIQEKLKNNEPVNDVSLVVRGFRVLKPGEPPSGLNGFLYSVMKNTKAQRRGVLTSLIKQFDDTAKSSLSLMLYLADNLAYIPFTVLDEPLFVIHQIDLMISVSGPNLLQTFKEALRPPPSAEERYNLETGRTEYIYDEDLDDDYESVLSRLPHDCRQLQDAITASQGCMLLLVLKDHLKAFYGLTTGKIQQYSPTDTSKAFDRQVNRKVNVRFNPADTVEILSRGPPPDVLSEEERSDLVKKYLVFKDLMNKIDPDDAEEDEDGTPLPGNESFTPQKRSMAVA